MARVGEEATAGGQHAMSIAVANGASSRRGATDRVTAWSTATVCRCAAGVAGERRRGSLPCLAVAKLPAPDYPVDTPLHVDLYDEVAARHRRLHLSRLPPRRPRLRHASNQL